MLYKNFLVFISLCISFSAFGLQTLSNVKMRLEQSKINILHLPMARKLAREKAKAIMLELDRIYMQIFAQLVIHRDLQTVTESGCSIISHEIGLGSDNICNIERHRELQFLLKQVAAYQKQLSEFYHIPSNL